MAIHMEPVDFKNATMQEYAAYNQFVNRIQ